MQPVTRLDDLRILACFLQDRLHANLGRIVPFEVQCIYKENTLWVLTQHPADVVIDIAETFRVLEQALQSEEPQTALPVKLYLRVQGKKQPYSVESFTVYPLVNRAIPGEAGPDTAPFHDLFLEDSNFFQPGEAIQLEEEEEQEIAVSKISTAVKESPKVSKTPSSPVEMNEIVASIPPLDVKEIVDDAPGAIAVQIDPPEDIPPQPQKFLQLPKMGLIGGGVGLALLGIGGYGLSRPCVLQSCPNLSTADQLSQQALQTFLQPASGSQVLTAQKQLRQAVDQLSIVPPWSGAYGQAQSKLKTYRNHAQVLDNTVEGMKQANQAGNKTKTLPVAIANWEESKKLWTSAVTQLEQVPPDSPIRPLAEQRLPTYRKNLQQVEQKLAVELKAQELLTSAQNQAIAISQQQGIAKNIGDWQGVLSEWQKFNQTIAQITPGTFAYQTAQDLSSKYQPQIATVSEKIKLEETATKNYQAGLKFAESARKSMQTNQLTPAINNWQQAIASLQNVAQGTSPYEQSQKLLAEYDQSFKKANSQQVQTQKLAKAEEDLKRTCTNATVICTYTITNNLITVKLLPTYEQTVRETAAKANNTTNDQIQLSVVNHVKTLGIALQTISDNAKIPLQLYDGNGKQMQVYKP